MVEQAVNAYSHLSEVGDEVVIIGGGVVGCELALDVAHKNKKVTIVEMAKELGGPALYDFRNGNKRINMSANGGPESLIESLVSKVNENKSIKYYTEARCTEIKDGQVVIEVNNNTITIDTNSVLLTTGFKADLDEAYSFYNIIQDTNIIGDLDRVSNIHHAVDGAFTLASSI